MTKKYLKILSVLFVAASVIWFLVLVKEAAGLLEIVFLDVGQGDAILIKTPENQTVLIDGGPGDGVLQKLGRHLLPLGRRIDVVILTHPHADHATGLVEVLKRYNVGLVILGGAELKTDVYAEFLKTIRDKNIPVVIAEAGNAVHFDKNLEFDVLSPQNSGELVFNKTNEGFGAGASDVNDASIVGKLMFKNFSVLLTGDATSKIENRLLIYGQALESDVLKIGHHGSKYSSAPLFLKTVSPKAAVIEVGAKNRYGHPSPSTLSRLKNLGVGVFRTDENGDVRILSDGFTAKVFTEKK